MSKRTRILRLAAFSVFLAFFSSTSGGPVRAAESGGINTKRAAKALLEGVRDFFKDLDEYQRLNTDEQKVQYILTKGSERIVQKSGELAWDRLKTEMAKVAEAKVREALMKEQVPAMMHKVLVEKMSESAAWATVNADILSKVDTRVNAVKTAIVTAKVAVKGLTDWRKTGDIRKGFEAFGKSAADEIAEYLIPGWKLYRVAQAIVEAICSYVVGYAFDTALEAKIKSVLPFPPESNPKDFVKWIQTVDINDHVTREWNEQLAHSGWYLKFSLTKKEGEESGDAMKNAIIAALVRMKEDVLAEQAKMEQVQREFDQKIRELEAKSNDANKQAMAILDQIFSAADPYLKMIEDYKAAAFPNKKRDLESAVTEAELAMNAVPTSVTYHPVDAGSILSDLDLAFSEVTEDYRSGYDYKKAGELWEVYLATRKRVIEEHGKQFADLAAQLAKATDPGEMSRLSKALYTEWPKKSDADMSALAAKEGLVTAEASERCRKMVDGLKEAFEKMRQDWESAYQAYKDAEEALADKIQTTFRYPDIYKNLEYGFQEYMPNRPDPQNPEDVLKSIEPLRMYKKDIEEDARRVSGIKAEHLSNVTKLEGVYHQLRSHFDRLVQKDYRKVEGAGKWDTESWTAYMHVTWTAGAPLEALQALRDEGAGVVTVYIGDRPWLRLKDEPDVAQGYETGLRWLSETVGSLELLERPAGLAVAYWRLINLPELFKYEDQFLDKVDMERLAHMKDGKWGASVKPEESDGVKFIEEMKKAWELRKEYVLEAQKIREAYLALSKTRFKYGDPAEDKLLDQYLKIPARIAEYEKTLAAESAKFKTMREAAANNLKIMQEQFENFKREIADAIPSTPLLEKLEAYQKETASSRRNTEILSPDSAEAIAGMEAIEEELTGMIAVCKAKMAMGASSGSGGSGGSGGGGSGSSQGSGSSGPGGGAAPNAPVLPEFYKLYDARLNTNSLEDASGGDVVVTNADLRSGAIEITARLSTIERVQSLLISEDGSRTWKELPVDLNVSYRFSPMAEMRYHLVLKIKTTDSQEAMIAFFPNVGAIVYKNIAYTDLAKEAVEKIANAYESQNVAAFAELISKNYIGNRVFLEEGVRFDFDMFTDIRLKIFIDRIEQREDQYVADTHWEKSQSPRSTGQQQRTTGRTVMTFSLEEGQLKIKNLRGNLLYATLSPEIAEASGLSQAVVEDIREAELERNPIQPGAGETENSGGVGGSTASDVQTGSFSVTQNDAMAGVPAWNQAFDFSSRTVTTLPAFDAGTGHDFLRWDGWLNVKASNGIVDMGAVNIDSVTEAPLSGYAATTGAVEASTYAIRLSDGTYALIQATAWDPTGSAYPLSTTFRYRHQRNGTRSFD